MVKLVEFGLCSLDASVGFFARLPQILRTVKSLHNECLGEQIRLEKVRTHSAVFRRTCDFTDHCGHVIFAFPCIKCVGQP